MENPSLNVLCHTQHKIQDHKDIWALRTSPIRTKECEQYLQLHPDKYAADDLNNDFYKGFEINYTDPRFHVYSKISSPKMEIMII